MALVARNGLWLTRGGVAAADPFAPHQLTSVPFGYDGLVQAMATGEMRLAAASNVQVYASTSNVLLGAQGTSNVLSVGSNAVTITGDLRVYGTMDTIASSEMHLQDKVVRVAVLPPEQVAAQPTLQVRDADLDASGLAIASGSFGKAVLWRAGALSNAGSNPALLTAELLASSNAPYWQLQGGGLRFGVAARSNAGLTAAGGGLGCALTFNADEEIEVYKVWSESSADAVCMQRIMVWAMSDPVNADTLWPQSTNPYSGYTF